MAGRLKKQWLVPELADCLQSLVSIFLLCLVVLVVHRNERYCLYRLNDIELLTRLVGSFAQNEAHSLETPAKV